MQETAINIGFACSLLRNDMTQYIISANLPEVLALEEGGKVDDAYALAHTKIGEQLQDALQCMAEARGAGGGDNALIIDGKALLHALDGRLKAQLLLVGHVVSPENRKERVSRFVQRHFIWQSSL